MADPEKLGFSSARLQRIKPAMEKHIGDHKLSGVVTAITRRGELVHHEAFGLMDRESQTPMAKDAIFRIFSMTKPITCVALMMLYEQGHFQLIDPVSKFIPAFKHIKVYTDDGLVDLAEPINIRHLLTHTSGLTYHFWEYGRVEEMYREAAVSSLKPLEEFVADLAAQPLAFQPGTNFRYSFSQDVVAHLVEIMSGQSFADYLEQHIFKPLGMVDSGFYVPKDNLNRLSAMYGVAELFEPQMTGTEQWEGADRGINKLIAGPTDSFESAPHNIFRGGHGLVSTAADYLRFCQMTLNGGELDGERILGRKTLQAMITNHLDASLLPYETGGIYSPGVGYGLGFGVLMDLGQYMTVGSVGEYNWSGAATTSFWIDPIEELIGFQAAQFQPMAYHLVAEDFRVAAYQALVD